MPKLSNRAGRTTSRRLVEQCLTRINDPKGEGARAFTKVYADAALAEADASDKLRALGVVRSPVEGIPISVKDLFDVAGDCTLAGSKALRNAAPATADAPAVARLRACRAYILYARRPSPPIPAPDSEARCLAAGWIMGTFYGAPSSLFFSDRMVRASPSTAMSCVAAST